MYILDNKFIVYVYECELPFPVCFMVHCVIFLLSIFYYTLYTKINILYMYKSNTHKQYK